MPRRLDFGNRPHRCLFRNDCVQAHLLALKNDSSDYEACFQGDATVIVTFGAACACFGGCVRQLNEGDQLEIPRSCPLRLSAEQAADVMLLVR